MTNTANASNLFFSFSNSGVVPSTSFLCIIFTTRCTSAVIAIVSRPTVRPSVRPSVRQSVTLTYRGHIGWTTLKLITRIISLRSSLLKLQHRQSSPKATPLKFGWNRGVVLPRKPVISLKRGKIGPRLLLTINRKSHTRFQLVPKSTTLDDLEWPLRTVFQNTCVFRSPSRKTE